VSFDWLKSSRSLEQSIILSVSVLSVTMLSASVLSKLSERFLFVILTMQDFLDEFYNNLYEIRQITRSLDQLPTTAMLSGVLHVVEVEVANVGCCARRPWKPPFSHTPLR